jgi:hypothetical protein
LRVWILYLPSAAMTPAGSGVEASGVVVAVVSSPFDGVVAGAGVGAVEVAGAVTVFVTVTVVVVPPPQAARRHAARVTTIPVRRIGEE